MMKNYITTLVHRYFYKRYNPPIEIKIQQWLLDGEHSAEKEEALIRIWECIDVRSDKSVYDSLKEVNARIGMESSRRWFLRHTLLRIAVVFFPLFLLTGVWVYKTNRIDTIEVITLAGEQKEIRLPDGSMVWLNVCSKISYPRKFCDTIRNVVLEGEACFSVVRDVHKRFEVTSRGVVVMVLGTQFNIKAYPDDESVTTTLTSGKITVLLPQERYMLRPGQELVYHMTGKNTIVRNVSGYTTGWREGVFIFNELSLSGIFKELERQFGVNFIYSQTTLPDDKYSVKFTHGEGLIRILDVLVDVTGSGFTYTINNQTITITIK